MKKSILTILLTCLTVILFLPSLSSALMVSLNISELTKESEVVVIGKVVKVKSYWSEDGDTIFTKAFIRVQKVIKGKVAQKKIVVEYEGGEVGDVGLAVSDMPTVKRGEKLILFLESKKAKDNVTIENVYEVVGNAQGKYTVCNNGIVKRDGFCVVSKKDIIDEDSMPTDMLINKIKEATK